MCMKRFKNIVTYILQKLFMLKKILGYHKNLEINYYLLFSTLFLIVLGLMMISSVSVFESYNVTQELVEKGLRQFPSNDFYLIRSIFYTILSLFLGFVAFLLPTDIWAKIAKPIFLSTLILLLLTFTGFGETLGGATAWLNFPGLPSIQPVELYKLGLIFYLSDWLSRRSQFLEFFEEGFLAYFFRVGILLLPLAMQPDFGSILILVPITVILYLFAGGRVKYILYVFIIGLVVGILVTLSFGYIRQRVNIFLNPESDPTNRGVGWQIEQSLIAVGSGGMFGRGVGNSIQKYGYLPEVQGDTIFAAIAEELGFFRLIFVIMAFAIIAHQGMQISMRSLDGFSALVTGGITSWIIVQAIINMAVTLNLFPLTGITLPFISYGGSSMVSLCIAMGILLAYSRNLSKTYEDHFYRRGDIRSRYTSTYSSSYTRKRTR